MLEIETLEFSEMISVYIKISFYVYVQYFGFVFKKKKIILTELLKGMDKHE